MERTARKVKCLDTDTIYKDKFDAAKKNGISPGTLGVALAPSGNGRAAGQRFAWVDEKDAASAIVTRRKPRTPARPAPLTSPAPLTPAATMSPLASFFAALADASAGSGRGLRLTDLTVTVEQVADGAKLTIAAKSLEAFSNTEAST